MDTDVTNTEYVVEIGSGASVKRLGTFNTYEEAEKFMDTLALRFIDYNECGDEVDHGLVV